MVFNVKALDKPARDPVVDDSWVWTARARCQSEGSQDWFLSSESVVVVVGNYRFCRWIYEVACSSACTKGFVTHVETSPFSSSTPVY